MVTGQHSLRLPHGRQSCGSERACAEKPSSDRGSWHFAGPDGQVRDSLARAKHPHGDSNPGPLAENQVS